MAQNYKITIRHIPTDLFLFDDKIEMSHTELVNFSNEIDQVLEEKSVSLVIATGKSIGYTIIPKKLLLESLIKIIPCNS